mgnify:CR=1 FL=1
MENNPVNEHLQDDLSEEKKKTNDKASGLAEDQTEQSSSTDPVVEKDDSVPDSNEPEELEQPEDLNSLQPKSNQSVTDEEASSVPAESDDKENIEETAGNEKDAEEDDLSFEAGEPAPPVVEKEKIDYQLLSQDDLVKMMAELLNKPFEEVKDDLEEIQQVYFARHESEVEKKKEQFIADGGMEQDFKPVEDPHFKEMEDLVEKFRSLKTEFNKQLEETKEVNLATKLEILEEFRLLMEGQEGFDNTFRKFKHLQTRWFEVGVVPKQNVKDLWNSYNFFVDKFNDYVKINRELRVLDLKKNLDMKIKLCEKAEALAADSNIHTAFKILQKLHAQWREIGPVPREDKDQVWERFKTATSVINKAHQNYQSDLKESLVENLERKQGLCEKAEQISQEDFDSHQQWVEMTNELLAIQKEWKTIGYAPKKDNNLIYARFRKACDTFFEKKAAFYSETFEHQKENLDKKRKIVEQAEELKDNSDWKNTTDKLIELQKKWKEIGPVPRKESDKLWKRFRNACDYFFNKKSEFFGGKNESYEDNLKEKQDLIKEMTAYTLPSDGKQVIQDIENFQQRYNDIGFVPVEQKDQVREDFKDALNAIIAKLKTDDEEKSLLRFRVRVASIAGNPKAESKLRFERDKLLNKLQLLRNDIGVWENNIGFFKQTESSENTISEFHEKIEDARKRIDNLEQKIMIIDEIEENL